MEVERKPFFLITLIQRCFRRSLRRRLLALTALIGAGGVAAWLVRRYRQSALAGHGRNILRNCIEKVLVKRRLANIVPDPTFGEALGLVYRRETANRSWEDFLNALSFPKDSPIRAHVRELFSREDMTSQLKGLYDALNSSETRPGLSRGDFESFSRGICGEVHMYLRSNTRVNILEATPEDFKWIKENFDSHFPPDRPLDRETFPAVAKLVILRRVVRTLLLSVGLEHLQEGTKAPLVVNVSVDLSNGRPPFRIHTVAPSSAPSVCSGERLDLIKE
eukprot:TRINITY_DN32290_c0_g1_i1.p1 TRINITY_DN32290_c0_g1~~TRINITY_DN32290_c0_g1_i1.p1  ORF type:complete len:277 (-),score=25.86 TRINITY_DN32290_c0_g1_i1:127-957(-)